MKCTAAPFLGSDIGDGLRKVPAVAVKVLSVVLTFAIGVVLGFRQGDEGTVLSCSLAVALASSMRTWTMCELLGITLPSAMVT